MRCMFIPCPRIQFEKFFQDKLFPDSAVSYQTVYFIQLFNHKEVRASLLLIINNIITLLIIINRHIFIIFVKIIMFITFRKCNTQLMKIT